ncbi:hypothetical protein GLAREA_09794 [Glarea lozoyensis ATCC 20868]|uniref:Tachykinin family protein n=1 Tax=Glarea lozoyensis (strain ATCC 20868 / MF5171) TaxID=1116229 RepID=S3DQB3_GLAL2|nr:uncharacterized protein GLAREA_09794 [Glarea lozoyensis ATCC 20868]EPE28673.1 hypothetical protein GLAREA_09794 [Glarea lozoyensis ATCC 20868]
MINLALHPTPPTQFLTHSETPALSFITLTGPTSNTKEISQQVRRHVMKDYARKSRSKDSVTAFTVSQIPKLESLGDHKGRFRLDTWKKKKGKAKASTLEENEKEKEKSVAHRKKERQRRTPESFSNSKLTPRTCTIPYSSPHHPKPTLSLELTLDPFNTLPISPSPNLIHYYQKIYPMNGIAINPTGTFFSHALKDPALLHSVLHLVSLHISLRYPPNQIQGDSEAESPESLSHGISAFSIINARLGTHEGISEMTIASVAMLASKENLNGKYNISTLHMTGLHHLIRARGGIATISGVFLRIVLWADLCFSNIQSRPPYFARQDFAPVTIPEIPSTDDNYLALPPALDKIFSTLRYLSCVLEPERVRFLDRLEASTLIYNVEYDILLHNTPLPAFTTTTIPPIHPLITATHVYLYISIREIPSTSPAISLMLSRLQSSLNTYHQTQDQSENTATDSSGTAIWPEEAVSRKSRPATAEAMTYHLWTLFIGYLASAHRSERYWFMSEIKKVLDALGIETIAGLQSELKKLLWREDFMREGLVLVWMEMVGEGQTGIV